MLGSWVIQTPRGRYYPRLLLASGQGLGSTVRAEREAVWFFARMDLARHDPRAVADALALYELLRGLPPPPNDLGTGSWWMDQVVHHLEVAVWDGRLDFERLPDLELPERGFVGPASRPFDPKPGLLHWLELEILDDETREPVSGMLVSLKLADGSVTQRTTDASGRIYVDGQPDETWEVIDVQAPVEVVGMG